jgi:hypothetical protein
MRVLAFLPDDSFLALKRALGPRDTVGRLTDAASLSRSSILRADAVVIDPTCFDDEGWTRVRQMLVTPRMPVLLYAKLEKESVRRIVAASAVGTHELLLRDVDDDPVALRRRLATRRKPAPPARVLSRLAPLIASTPPALQRATVPLFCAAPVPTSLRWRRASRDDRWTDGWTRPDSQELQPYSMLRGLPVSGRRSCSEGFLRPWWRLRADTVGFGCSPSIRNGS